MQTYADVHRWADIKMVNYIVRPQANHAVTPWSGTLCTLQDDHLFELYANGATARIAFTEIALEHVLACEGVQRGPLCFVTLVPNLWAEPMRDRWFHSHWENARRRRESDAAKFEIMPLQQMARQALGDVPFVGMVEMVLWRRWGPHGRDWLQDWVSWHCHLLTWGIDQKALSRRLDPFRERHRSLLSNIPSAHVLAFDADQLEQKLAYMLKAPQKMTRVEYLGEWVSPITGEVRPAGLHAQKDWLQTGHRLRCADIMGPRTLDKLLFGNGEGTSVVRAIRAESLAPFRAWERRQPWAQRRG